MNEEQLKLIEENIAEVISGNILLASDGPRIAAMVMERLEVKELLKEGSSGSIDTEKFKFSTGWWSEKELDECCISYDKFDGCHMFEHSERGELKLYDKWITDHTAEGIMYMVDLIHKKSGEIT